jgi:hypothetical protein
VALSPERRTGLDGKAAVPLPKPLPPAKKLLADKAYDRAALRDWLARRGTIPVQDRARVLPPQSRAPHRYRYGKCADNFLSAVCLIAAIYFWLN